MKGTDRSILAGLLLAVVALGFWFMILGPKRQKSSELSDQAAQLEQSVSEQESVAAFAEEARKDFPKYYGRLVVLGKAVPDQADSASLLVQLSDISSNAGVEFRGLELGDGGGGAPPPPPEPSVAETASEPSASDAPTEETATTTTTTTAVPATEAAAASLPIGSTVGPAGLPVLNYTLTFGGHFFDTADFIAGVDKLIKLRSGGNVAANGRLLTVDGFSMIGDPEDGFPLLEASFVVNAYATPSTQGLTLGASPTAPAPAPVPGAIPASTEVAP